MTNDTTRVEAKAMTWKEVAHESMQAVAGCKGDWLALSEQLLEIGKRVAANPPTDDQATITSLQRELAEARAECERRKQTVSLAERGDVGVWVWGGDEHDHPESLTCPILISAEQMRSLLAKPSPGPSDAKGEGEADERLREAQDALIGLAAAAGVVTPEKRADLSIRQLRRDFLKAIESLKSRASLTPLTDESVRGVLVDDGEPRRRLNFGEQYFDAKDGTIGWCGESGDYLRPMQPVRLRPASEFGVPGEPAQKLVPLPDGAVVSIPLTAEQTVTEDRDRLFWVSSNRNMRVGWHKLLDYARYGVPQAERVRELEQRIQQEMRRIRGLTKQNREQANRVTELSVKLAESRSEVDQLQGRVRELEAELATLEERRRNDNMKWIGFYRDELEKAERLRKAIVEAREFMVTARYDVAERVLAAALTPSPAASGELLISDAECAAAWEEFKRKHITPQRLFSLARMGGHLTSAETSHIAECKSCGDAFRFYRDHHQPASAPAAESQGNAQHHSEGAKIPDGGSGSSAEGSEPTHPTAPEAAAAALTSVRTANLERHQRISEEMAGETEESVADAIVSSLESFVDDLKTGGGPKLRTSTVSVAEDGTITRVLRNETASEAAGRIAGQHAENGPAGDGGEKHPWDRQDWQPVSNAELAALRKRAEDAEANVRTQAAYIRQLEAAAASG